MYIEVEKLKSGDQLRARILSAKSNLPSEEGYDLITDLKNHFPELDFTDHHLIKDIENTWILRNLSTSNIELLEQLVVKRTEIPVAS